MPRAAALAVALALAGPPAGAAVVGDCDTPLANARNLARPIAGASREFSNGEVAFLYVLLDEPACCGAHLMVLWPDPETGHALCRFVSTADGLGWSTLDLAAARAAYDPARGLAVAVPATRWDGEASFVPFTLTVSLDRAAGLVTATEGP